MVSTGSPVGELAALVAGKVVGDPTVVVRDVTHDSRQAGPGALFVAIPGASHDGHDFAGVAVEAGSPALMVERVLDVQVSQLIVDTARAAMAPVAAEIYGHPSRSLQVVGVTGTNGKTTVTHMVEAIATVAGKVTGLIGTVHTRVAGNAIPNIRTTPESSDLQRLLASMVDLDAEVVAAEVSSHAIELHRVDATRFAVAAFTNLSQDHLDFHGDMESYFDAKARLFDPDRSSRAVIWVDDPAGRRLRERVDIPVMTVGSGADISGENRELDVGSSLFRLNTPAGSRTVRLPLGGGFNVDNALIATGCALAIGLPFDAVVEALESFGGVPGRFELVSDDDPVRIVVDYAHTPAGIAAAIAAVRELRPSGRVMVVFGAGGDRDAAKRPQMGAAALDADVVIVTSDNPRTEDPENIVAEIMEGIDRREGVRTVLDRREAITEAVEMAGEGDVVLILGRGHERGQEVHGRFLPLDDRQIARSALADKRGATP